MVIDTLCVSQWLSKNFTNNKVPFLQYMIETNSTKKNLRQKLKIKKNKLFLDATEVKAALI